MAAARRSAHTLLPAARLGAHRPVRPTAAAPTPALPQRARVRSLHLCGPSSPGLALAWRKAGSGVAPTAPSGSRSKSTDTGTDAVAQDSSSRPGNATLGDRTQAQDLPAGQPIGRIEPRLSLTFTCTVPDCGTRSSHEFARKSYQRGIVLVQCPGCKNRHLIADHLGWFKESTEDGTLKTVEDLLRAKGEQVRRGVAVGRTSSGVGAGAGAAQSAVDAKEGRGNALPTEEVRLIEGDIEYVPDEESR